jgi:predicted transcriptional regulator
MPVHRTSLYLSDSLRRRLREVASRRDRSVNDLILEAIEKFLDTDTQQEDASRLRRKAAEARERLRSEGLFSAFPLADRIDEVLYGSAAHEPAAPGYGDEPAAPSPRRRTPKRRRPRAR